MLKKLARRFWYGWGKDVLFVLLILVPIRSSIADWNDVPTGSMKPTILEGDRIFVNKLAYDLKVPLTTWHIARWSNPERGDIVVCFSPEDGKRLVKRVVAVPGDTIGMQGSRLVINGQPATYTVLDQAVINHVPEEDQSAHRFAVEHVEGRPHAVMLTPSLRSIRSFAPVVVPEGKYMLMGDNRDNSHDSRYFGFVDRKEIVGQGSAVVLSFDFKNYFQPRFNRWFRKLR